MHHERGREVSLGVSGSPRQSGLAPRGHTSRPLGNGWATSRPLGRRLANVWRTGGGSTGGWVLRGRASPSATRRRTRGSQSARRTATRASCGAHRASGRHNRLTGLRGSDGGACGASGSPGGPPTRGGGAFAQISTATGGLHRRRQPPATATSSWRALRAWESAACTTHPARQRTKDVNHDIVHPEDSCQTEWSSQKRDRGRCVVAARGQAVQRTHSVRPGPLRLRGATHERVTKATPCPSQAYRSGPGTA